MRIIWLIFLFWMPFLGYAQSAILSDQIVITVGDQVITRSEFESEKTLFKKINGVNLENDTQKKKFNEDFAKFTVEMEMQLQTGKMLGVELDSSDKSVLESQLISRYQAQSKEEFIELLRERGIGYEAFMQQLLKQFMVKKIQSFVLSQRIRLSDLEVERAYQQRMDENMLFYVEDIVFNTERASASKHDRLSEKAIQLSEDWKKRTFSAGTVPKSSKMLSFKWKSLNQLPELFRKTIAGMHVGNVSPSIKAGNGFHVLKLIKKKHPKGFKVDKDQLKQELYLKKMEAELPKWLADLREQVYIDIQLD